MDEKLMEIRGNERISKQLNNLSVEEVVNMIESSNEPCQESNKKKKKKKNKKKKDAQQNFEEEIENKTINDKFSAEIPININQEDFDEFHKENQKAKLQKEMDALNEQFEYIDEEKLIEEFRNNLIAVWEKARERLKPNLNLDWVHSLRKKLTI
jgi:hypothetical protein